MEINRNKAPVHGVCTLFSLHLSNISNRILIAKIDIYLVTLRLDFNHMVHIGVEENM